MLIVASVAAIPSAMLLAQPPQQQPPQPMSFFVTSAGKGDGANLGGIAGADAHCQALAAA
ncbi:MAG: lectin, partial [Acidobacteria bacterium]